MLQEILRDEIDWKVFIAFLSGCIYLMVSLRLFVIARSEESALKRKSSVIGLAISTTIILGSLGWLLRSFYL